MAANTTQAMHSTPREAPGTLASTVPGGADVRYPARAARPAATEFNASGGTDSARHLSSTQLRAESRLAPSPFREIEIVGDADEEECVHVIDDDPSVRSALFNLVSAAGLRAEAYESVDGFLADHEHAQAGCFLLDVRLPGVNGLDFLTGMTAMGLHLPVILISGHGDVPMTVRGMKAGAVDFLTKPFQPHEVLDAVSRALEQDRGRRRDAASHSGIVTRYESLTRRERQVMALVTSGKMNKQTAWALELSEITVKVYRAAVMRKMGVRTLSDLVKASELLAILSPGLLVQPQP